MRLKKKKIWKGVPGTNCSQNKRILNEDNLPKKFFFGIFRGFRTTVLNPKNPFSLKIFKKFLPWYKAF
jgi:hypothetical protein